MHQAAAKLLVPSKLLVIYYQIPHWNPRVLWGEGNGLYLFNYN
jgi:hypothetical protein